MEFSADHEAFLSTVESYNDRFNALRFGKDQILLAHTFWNRREIERGISLREGWGLPEHLVPFYGDWHTLLCLSLTDGEILLLDDSRQVGWRWLCSDAFIGSLVYEPEKAVDSSIIVEDKSWLDF